MIANGDMVGVVACWRGTYKGPFFGIEPTGREVEMRGIVLWRIAEGQLAERFTTTGIWDGLPQRDVDWATIGTGPYGAVRRLRVNRAS